jgi:hypothetical protein
MIRLLRKLFRRKPTPLRVISSLAEWRELAREVKGLRAVTTPAHRVGNGGEHDALSEVASVDTSTNYPCNYCVGVPEDTATVEQAARLASHWSLDRREGS